MGTTEVQRTLVKSPPELWSELSDQDSLGRLLSDLGEVRIVSTVADSAVYWESDDVTGSALIKQAGWGTKVTLTVTLANTRHVPRDATHAGPGVGRRLRGVAHPPHGRRPARDRRALITSTRDRAHLVRSGELRSCPGPRPRRPTPLRRAPWRTHPIRRRTTPPRCRTPSAPRCLTATAAHPDAADRTPDDGEPTRRGFFARFFGRRSRRREESVQPRERPAAAPSSEPAAVPEPAPATALEALQARYGVRPAATEPSAPAAPTPVPAAAEPSASAPTTAVPAGAEPSAPTPPEPAQAATADPEPVPTPPEPSAAETAQPESPPDPTTPPDLSSELRSAEEVPAGDVKAGPTEDQVKEILTGVLDRLGAAHHRPFSRA